VTELDRGRLIQERWFCLVRWLLLEAFLFQIEARPDVPRALDILAGYFLYAVAGYALLVTILSFVRKSWPVPLAYATATIDTVAAVLIAAVWSDQLINPGMIAVAATGVAVGLRRFPVFETLAYSFIIGVGLLAVSYGLHVGMVLDNMEIATIAAMALIPPLVRVGMLAPHLGAGDEPMARMARGALGSAAELASVDAARPDALLFSAADSLVRFTNSSLGGALVRHADRTIDIYTVLGDDRFHERLKPQNDEQIASRLLAVNEATIITRADQLGASGLPEQYPAQLDAVVVAPAPGFSTSASVIFAANRREAPYRSEDRVVARLLGAEAARLYLAEGLAASTTEARQIAVDTLLAAAEVKRTGAVRDAEECARFAVAIAREMGWAEDAIEQLRYAALLHDVGEMALPDALLDKADPLLPEEYDIIKQHPRYAAKMMDPFNRFQLILDTVYSHHERWDGKGYPSGLAGEEIPIGARIVSLADSIQSMLSPKVFRSAIPPTEALQQVILGSGTQFDPSVVQAFLAVLRREGQTFLDPQGVAGPVHV
jgi:HD-GYP domain-containing protein (c-di-GMP phosphodiesterase class II)